MKKLTRFLYDYISCITDLDYPFRTMGVCSRLTVLFLGIARLIQHHSYGVLFIFWAIFMMILNIFTYFIITRHKKNEE